MVGSISPHAYSAELFRRGGSPGLLREIRSVEYACESSGVAPIFSLTHLCVLARIPYNSARDAIFNPADQYRTRRIAKRSGSGYRLLHEPNAPLKSIHKTILSNALPDSSASPISFAFESGRGTRLAAMSHLGARSMIQIDLYDFFGSIGSREVYKAFRDLGYPELLSLELSLLTTIGHTVLLRTPNDVGTPYEILKSGRLPQGVSTSGNLSNLICASLDKDLRSIAENVGGSITRYADDIAISLPRAISESEAHKILRSLSGAARNAGLRLNRRKTKVFRNASSFKLLGLVVDQEGVRLNRHYKRGVRAHLYGMRHFGVHEHALARGFASELDLSNFMWGHFAYSYEMERSFAYEIQETLDRLNVRRI